jgi:hypothetical protein
MILFIYDCNKKCKINKIYHLSKSYVQIFKWLKLIEKSNNQFP